MISEQRIIKRVKELRASMSDLNVCNFQDNKVNYLKYYMTLAKIDVLMELLPSSHWFRKENEDV